MWRTWRYAGKEIQGLGGICKGIKEYGKIVKYPGIRCIEHEANKASCRSFSTGHSALAFNHHFLLLVVSRPKESASSSYRLSSKR